MRELLRVTEVQEELGSGPRPSGLQGYTSTPLPPAPQMSVRARAQRSCRGAVAQAHLMRTLLENSSQESLVTTCWALSVLSPTPTSMNKQNTQP